MQGGRIVIAGHLDQDMNTRRGFLAAMIGGAASAAAAMTFDPERALFVPGKKLISIPKPPVKSAILGELYWTNNGIFLYDGKRWMKFERSQDTFIRHCFLDQLPHDAVPVSEHPYRSLATLMDTRKPNGMTFTDLANGVKNASADYRR